MNDRKFCKLGKCWCDKLEKNTKHGHNVKCIGILKLNELDNGETSTGWCFINLIQECPYTDKTHTKLKDNFIKQGFYINEQII